MKQKQEYDEQIRIILLGDNGVGKSCLLQSYFGKIDLYSYQDTAGVDLKIKILKTQNKTIRLRLWDASGNPKLQNLIATYFQHADGALVCFDVTNIESFQNIKAHIERFRACRQQAPVFLVGCKSDLNRMNRIFSGEAKELADALGVPYFEVSALKKININEVFEQSAQQIYFLIQRDRIKPLLIEIFNHYLKAEPQKSHSGFFSVFSQNLSKEELLKEEHKYNLEKLFQATNSSDLDDFCIKTLELLEKTDLLFKNNNPYWSSITSSPLSKVLQRTLNVLCGMPPEMINVSYLKELILQNKAIQTQFKMVSA